MLWERGFAGITYPKQYGGQGLTAAHLHAFTDEARAYDLGGCGPMFAMTLGMMGPTLLELGSDDLKARYLPGMIRGDDLWVQFLSEPTGGSDLAGAVTRATRDGDRYLLTGSKVWTSAADYSDYGFCLARTDWDVPKHRGLTMFVVPLRAPGLEVIPLRLVTGATGFCQEFFDDVAVPASRRRRRRERRLERRVAAARARTQRDRRGLGVPRHGHRRRAARRRRARRSPCRPRRPRPHARPRRPTRTAASSSPRPTCSPPSTVSSPPGCRPRRPSACSRPRPGRS